MNKKHFSSLNFSRHGALTIIEIDAFNVFYRVCNGKNRFFVVSIWNQKLLSKKCCSELALAFTKCSGLLMHEIRNDFRKSHVCVSRISDKRYLFCNDFKGLLFTGLWLDLERFRTCIRMTFYSTFHINILLIKIPSCVISSMI